MGYRSVQYKMWEDGPLRDLSAWRLTIPKIVLKPDPDNLRKNIHVFVIEVRRVDVLESKCNAVVNGIPHPPPPGYVGIWGGNFGEIKGKSYCFRGAVASFSLENDEDFRG